jgi:hypothetical protein
MPDIDGAAGIRCPAGEPDRRVAVRFAGDRGGSAPLTWGQRDMWKAIRWLGDEAHYFNVPCVVPVPHECDLNRVLRALGGLVERHEALRTRYRCGPGEEPRQIVVQSGTFVVDVYQTGRPVAEETTAAVLERLAATSFDADSELSLRAAVVADAGTPLVVVLVLNHQSVDAWSVDILTGDLTRLFAADPGAAGSGRAGWQPLDQARYENSDHGVRRGKAALDYWQRTLLATPRSMFDLPRGRTEASRYVRLGMESAAVAVAAEQLATRFGVSRSAVLLAGSAALLGLVTGHEDVTMQLIVANRLDERRRGLVSVLALNGLFAVDLRNATFVDVVQRAYHASLVAYRYGWYDPFCLDRRLADIELERGVSIDHSAFFNDARMDDRWQSLPSVAGEKDLLALAEKTAVSFVGSWPRQDSTFFVHTTYHPDACLLYLMADTAVLPTDTIAATLRGIERVLVRAAYHDVRLSDLPVLTGLHQLPRGPDWVRCAAGWASLDAVGRLLTDVTGTDRLAVFAVPTANGQYHEIVAYVAADPAETSLDRLHHAVVAALKGRTDVLAPHRYHLCTKAPPDAGELAQWRNMPVFAHGSGRTTLTGVHSET